MKKNISKPSLRLVASSAEARQKFITLGKASAQASAIQVGTFCHSARRIIESVVLVLLFMLGLVLLSLITAAKEIWNGWLKGLSTVRNGKKPDKF